MPSYLRMVERAAKLARLREDEDRRRKQAQRDSSCTGKKLYTTFTAAARDARSVKKHHGVAMQPYACKVCHKFHVGAPNR
jgi:hypothetical protein